MNDNIHTAEVTLRVMRGELSTGYMVHNFVNIITGEEASIGFGRPLSVMDVKRKKITNVPGTPEEHVAAGWRADTDMPLKEVLS